MSYRHVFENSKDGKCTLCGSEAEERRNNSNTILNGWFCSNKNCDYSFDNFLEKMNKIRSENESSGGIGKILKYVGIGVGVLILLNMCMNC